MHFPYRATFESELGRSEWIHELAPTVIRFNESPNFRLECPPGSSPRSTGTMFREIEMVSPSETWADEVKAVLETERVSVSEEEFFNKVFAAFKEAVWRAWRPGVQHVVLHSSGYDSRLLSYTIKELGLTDVLFLELEGEAEAVREILRREGWPASSPVVYNEEAQPRELHERSCEFEHAYLRTNAGMYTRGFNFWWEPVEWLGLDDFQGWTGYYANDVLEDINRLGAKEAFEGFGYDVYALVPMKGEWVLPYLDLGFLEALIRFGQGQRPHYQKNLLEWLAPEVAEVEPMLPVYNLRELSDRLTSKMQADYQGSWYGGWVKRNVKPCRYTTHDEWWGHFGLASYCEYARARGHKIILAGWQPGNRMKQLRDR